MAICEMHLSQSNVLQQMTAFTAIVPEGKTGPFPVYYLLHGLSDDHTAWSRRTSIERYVADMPIIIVMPNGGRSFYTDAIAPPNAKYETFMTQDLIRFVDSTFQTIPAREGRAVGGLSMGGYGALKLALKHPDIYCAAVSHSGAVNWASQSWPQSGAAPSTDPTRSPEWSLVLGDNPKGGDDDIYALAERADRGTLPAISIDCGLDDFLLDHNRQLHSHLTDLGIPHDYSEYAGDHEWGYWDLHCRHALKFVGRAFGLG